MADFWAGYMSGVVGVIIGSPLDIIKTRSQSRVSTAANAWCRNPASLFKGAEAPILGYGALNALLFFSYNRSLELLHEDPIASANLQLWKVWLGGAIGGLSCSVITTPVELVKCQQQVTLQSSFVVTRDIYRRHGLKGYYLGGVVTSMRDFFGYGFYFWAYESFKHLFKNFRADGYLNTTSSIIIAGGLAGCVSWTSVYPLDVLKTQVQVEAIKFQTQDMLLSASQRKSVWDHAKQTYNEAGIRAFWNGIRACLARAFIVNAVMFFTYEWAMAKFESKPE